MTYRIVGLARAGSAHRFDLFANPQIGYIGAHKAAHGCFSARISRNAQVIR